MAAPITTKTEYQTTLKWYEKFLSGARELIKTEGEVEWKDLVLASSYLSQAASLWVELKKYHNPS